MDLSIGAGSNNSVRVTSPITLNSSVTCPSAVTLSGGLTANSTTTEVLQATDGTVTHDLGVVGNIAGNTCTLTALTTGTASAGSCTVDHNLGVGGNVNVQGNAAVTGTLGVHAAATFDASILCHNVVGTGVTCTSVDC